MAITRPALRGTMGSTTYYEITMTARELTNSVRPAPETAANGAFCYPRLTIDYRQAINDQPSRRSFARLTKTASSFVRPIERAPDAPAIVHAVVSLGRGLGMKVTAEGVETAEQHLFLRAAGVHSLQGYRFGRPCTAAEITARLVAPHPINIADDVVDLAKAG